jgi:hypothetical protein
MRIKVGFFLLLLYNAAWSQTTKTVSGTVSDSTDNVALIGATVMLQPVNDTINWRGVTTDVNGKFNFSLPEKGSYRIKVSYIGYATRVVRLSADDQVVDIRMKPDAQTLKGVEVKGALIRVEQKGDTLQYNANAFKTNRDANAEDLIAKMPGITTDNTGVKAQGENVQQILVDGKQFFGDDATMALKNLPAELIEKIEVFDQLSEQSQFTGFDDGQTRKTINLVTKKGKNNGQFGRVYAGGGEGGRYIAGGSINSFNGNRRLTVIGLSNNINQQNFGNEDLLGVTGSSGSQGGRGGRGGDQRGGSNANFSVGQQSGISRTNSFGFNYGDTWGKKTEVTASYFFNRMDNERLTDLSRRYITQQDSGLVYNEINTANNTNYNHRFNARLEYTIDTLNSIVLTPKLSVQQNEALSLLRGNYMTSGELLRNQIDNRSGTDNRGYNFSNGLVYRHRFKKRRRSLSLAINTEINNRAGESELRSVNDDQSSDEPLIINQESQAYTDSYTLSSTLSYTEPVGKQAQLQLSYTPALTKSKTDKQTYNLDDETETYTELDTLLTNSFENSYVSNRGGLSYRYSNKKYNLNTGLNYQHASLKSDQKFPYAFQVDRSFQNILPQVSLNYKIEQGENLRLTYRTTTTAPSISQLQNVIDNRNPLFLKTGNPALSQNYAHNLTARYSRNDLKTSATWLLLVSGSFVQDYITNASYIAVRDTLFQSVALSQGTQLSYPVNTDGYRNARTLVTYGRPVNVLKSNLNVNTGVTYNRAPGIINNLKNLADNYTFSQGLVISSNVNEEFDFTLSYTVNYTVVRNSLQKQSDNNYFNQMTTLRLNWMFWKGFVFNTTVNNTLYRGLSAEFDRSIWLWNAGLGYKFLKNQALEFKISAFDILNNNNSITRDIGESYIEDRRTNVLNRYFMVTATYTLRRFKG